MAGFAGSARISSLVAAGGLAHLEPELTRLNDVNNVAGLGLASMATGLEGFVIELYLAAIET